MKRRYSIEIEGLHHGGMPIPLAAKIGNVLFSGGLMGMEPGSGTLAESIEEQCHHLFNNIRRVMKGAGGSPDDILKMTFYVKDRSSRDAINTEWVAMFPDAASRPARHTLTADLQSPLLVDAINVPVIVGGVCIEPGDYLRGDGVGVVDIPTAQANEVLAIAQEIHHAEGRIRADVMAGSTLCDARARVSCHDLQKRAVR